MVCSHLQALTFWKNLGASWPQGFCQSGHILATPAVAVSRSGLRHSHGEVGMNKFFQLSTFVWQIHIQVLLKARCHQLKQNYTTQRTCCLVNTHLEMSFVAVVMKMTSWRKLALLQGMLSEARNFVVEIQENLEKKYYHKYWTDWNKS